MATFSLADYATVAERITQFYSDHPNGRILTELLIPTYTDDAKVVTQFVVKASIYADREDERPVATGLAEEQFSGKGPNQTSPLENCETSAIGRALVNWKYSSSASDRPSREEMEKVGRGAPSAYSTVPGASEETVAELKIAAKAKGIASKGVLRDTMAAVVKRQVLEPEDLTQEEAEKIIKYLEAM